MPTTRPPRLFLRWSTTRCSEPGCFCFHDALRNLCGAFLLCACTQQFLGASQPFAAKRGGGFPLQCVLNVAALLFPTHSSGCRWGFAVSAHWMQGQHRAMQDFGSTLWYFRFGTNIASSRVQNNWTISSLEFQPAANRRSFEALFRTI